MRGPIFLSRISESECAGSVENKRMRSSCLACSSKHSAVAQATVVLPTPPLPPKKKNLVSGIVTGDDSDFFFAREGGGDFLEVTSLVFAGVPELLVVKVGLDHYG